MSRMGSRLPGGPKKDCFASSGAGWRDTSAWPLPPAESPLPDLPIRQEVMPPIIMPDGQVWHDDRPGLVRQRGAGVRFPGSGGGKGGAP